MIYFAGTVNCEISRSPVDISNISILRFAGVEQGNVMMVRNHSLVITNATTANTGHYLCSGVNTAGAAIERSQVTRIFAGAANRLIGEVVQSRRRPLPY